VPRAQLSAGVRERDAAAGVRDRADLARARDHPAGCGEVRAVSGGNRRVVDDAGRGRVQRGEPARVRLELADPGGVEASQPGDAVGAPAALELVEGGQL
jgi:hypothetical protein